jgi:hypothetical protein
MFSWERHRRCALHRRILPVVVFVSGLWKNRRRF